MPLKQIEIMKRIDKRSFNVLTSCWNGKFGRVISNYVTSNWREDAGEYSLRHLHQNPWFNGQL